MKYGIRVKYNNGNVKYVSSTRFRAALTSDIIEMALFVQESSAVTALKTIRKDGHEPKDATMDVIGIMFSVAEEIEVPRAEKVEGYILVANLLPKDQRYYIGTKKPGVYPQYNHFGNVERVTVFATEKAATIRLEQLIQEACSNLAKANKSASPRSGVFETISEYKKSEVQYAQTILDKINNLKVVKHEG